MESRSPVSDVTTTLKDLEHEERVMTIRPDFSFHHVQHLHDLLITQHQHQHHHHRHQQENTTTIHDKATLDSELRFLPSYLAEQPPPGIENICSRCKKNFTQDGPKPFKTCLHCRELQRQRSRRWQVKTKQKDGICTRCGTVIPEDQNQFVLCPNCRKSLRSKKAARGMQGKCIHCSGLLESTRSKFKVCARCRKKDRTRRQNLETNGYCVRCAKSLANELHKFKICNMCRERRNNPNFMPNARFPNILNAAYNQGYLQQDQEEEEGEEVEEPKEHDLRKNDSLDDDDDDDGREGNNQDHDEHSNEDDEEEDEVLRAAQLIIPNYSSHHYESRLSNDTVSETLALVLTLADDNNLLEGNYFSVDNKT